jgi:DNA-binding beta-propeller fold protein YncE
MKHLLAGACAIAMNAAVASAADMVTEETPPATETPAVAELWSLGGFSHPESVYADAARNVLYVSNVGGAPLDKDGNGFISRISRDGKLETLKWIEGLNAPKGMVMQGDTLWVSDINRLVQIDAATGKIVKGYFADGAVFLNDTAVDDAGNVYVSDIAKRKIWRLAGGKMEVWYGEDSLMHPNGLRVEGGKLIVAGWGRDMNDDGSTKTPGNLFTIDLATKEVANLGGGQGVGNLDGLERDAHGGFLVTDFIKGALYRIREDGSFETLVDLNPGSADLEAMDDGKVAVIPVMLDDKVTAFSVP